mmetsp:Transcript_13378/g.40078  ORF Transcript_13378/g.40078 Transcript_13378/m.40078 type:complete len:281 (+) Transcript_13378:1-843(+)
MLLPTLRTTMPTESAATPWLSSAQAPSPPSTRTKSPTSSGASGRREGPLSVRARRSCVRFLPSEQRILAETPSAESQTTPPRLPEPPSLAPSSCHSTRLPGHVSHWAAAASLRLASGSQRPLLPGKSTATAWPSMAFTRPTSPGGMPGGRLPAAAASSARVTKRPGKMPARWFRKFAEAARSLPRALARRESSSDCSLQCSRSTFISASIAASSLLCFSWTSDLSFSNCSSFDRSPSRSSRNSSYSFLSMEHISASPEVTPTRRMRCSVGLSCFGWSDRM